MDNMRKRFIPVTYAFLAAIFYAVAPFVGAFLSFALVGESLTWVYFIALLIMIAGTVSVVMDTLARHHAHPHTHTFTHTHDGTTHVHTIVHTRGHDHYTPQELHTHRHLQKGLHLKEEHV